MTLCDKQGYDVNTAFRAVQSLMQLHETLTSTIY